MIKRAENFHFEVAMTDIISFWLMMAHKKSPMGLCFYALSPEIVSNSVNTRKKSSQKNQVCPKIVETANSPLCFVCESEERHLKLLFLSIFQGHLVLFQGEGKKSVLYLWLDPLSGFFLKPHVT